MNNEDILADWNSYDKCADFTPVLDKLLAYKTALEVENKNISNESIANQLALNNKIQALESLAKDICQQDQVRGYPPAQEWNLIVNKAKELLK